MKRKGFTLVELMGVIIILGIIILLATPIIRTVTTDSKEELYNIQISNIEDALKTWAVDNNRTLPQNEGETITVTLGQLKMGGYIDSELKNPMTNQCFGNDMTLTITRYQKNYLYKANTETDTENSSCDNYIKPYIILNGETVTYVEVNDTYVDLGVVAKDELGNDITSSVVTTISGSGTTVDTSVLGNRYTITYSVTTGTNTESINRTVIVSDSTAPILTIPANVELDIVTTTFDVMEDVVATDNSGETVTVTAKSNISFGIPGEYTITYSVSDSSGNTTVKKRVVRIGKVVNGIMTSNSNCIQDANICSAGTEVSIQVNSTKTYNFYVINDTGEKLTLIMDRNLGTQVAWISDEDYGCDSAYCAQNDKGPITVLNYLNSETADWTNIPAIESYTYYNNENETSTSTDTYGYQKLIITNGTGILTSQDGTATTTLTGTSRARMLTYEEASDLAAANSNTTPTWLYTNLSSSNAPDGYWFLTASSSFSNYGRFMYCYGAFSSSISVYNETSKGARPVITLEK